MIDVNRLLTDDNYARAVLAAAPDAAADRLIADLEERCALCQCKMDPGNGDNWDDFCPGCADRMSEYMDTHGVDRDSALHALRSQDENPEKFDGLG
jgi:hypothetical protein